MNEKLTTDFILEVRKSKKLRKQLAKDDILWFFVIYFPHYIEYEIAEFHREMLQLLQDPEVRFLVIVAFRGSAKSTYCQLVYPLWMILCKREKNFVVLVNQTQTRAQQALDNIKQECESNTLLIRDFGPFPKELGEWSNSSLVFTKQQARITAVSISEKIRGFRHRQFRPDLIVADDIEDVASAKTAEGRKKAWDFLNSELIPSGDKNTKVVMIGNLVHSDSIMMRMKTAILNKTFNGSYRQYPLIDQDSNLWPGKYPNQKSINNLKNIVSNTDFQREFMLKIIADDEQIIKPEWLHYYDGELPYQDISRIIISIDPAFAQHNTNDNVAIVTGSVINKGRSAQIYVHPFPINKRIRMPDLIEEVKSMFFNLKNIAPVEIVVEEAGQQAGLIQSMEREGLPVKGATTGGKDKGERLASASYQVKNGKVKFHRSNNSELINQILYFGSEKHDDLADAFSQLAYEFLNDLKEPEVPFIDFL
ncbi:MAG: phage terminase large subunit [Patescibacteria group bacterium]